MTLDFVNSSSLSLSFSLSLKPLILHSQRCTIRCQNHGGWFLWAAAPTEVDITTTLIPWCADAIASSPSISTSPDVPPQPKLFYTEFSSCRKKLKEWSTFRCGIESNSAAIQIDLSPPFINCPPFQSPSCFEFAVCPFRILGIYGKKMVERRKAAFNACSQPYSS